MVSELEAHSVQVVTTMVQLTSFNSYVVLRGYTVGMCVHTQFPSVKMNEVFSISENERSVFSKKQAQWLKKKNNCKKKQF